MVSRVAIRSFGATRTSQDCESDALSDKVASDQYQSQSSNTVTQPAIHSDRRYSLVDSNIGAE